MVAKEPGRVGVWVCGGFGSGAYSWTVAAKQSDAWSSQFMRVSEGQRAGAGGKDGGRVWTGRAGGERTASAGSSAKCTGERQQQAADRCIGIQAEATYMCSPMLSPLSSSACPFSSSLARLPSLLLLPSAPKDGRGTPCPCEGPIEVLELRDTPKMIGRDGCSATKGSCLSSRGPSPIRGSMLCDSQR